jgi:hypothetical protein
VTIPSSQRFLSSITEIISGVGITSRLSAPFRRPVLGVGTKTVPSSGW